MITPKIQDFTSIAFIGNSILYYNDCPRLMQSLEPKIVQNSCLRGGTSFVKILEDGNGMQKKFRTTKALLLDGSYDIGASTVVLLFEEEDWDFVVMNDYTQAPARPQSRESTINILKSDYAPLFSKSGAVPVFLMTWAYRKQVNNSEDLGSVEEFTQSLNEGYHTYARVLDDALGKTNFSRVAPVGLAFLEIYRTNRTFWEKLFYIDDYHPSPHGTYLEACVLHYTLFGFQPTRVIDNVKSLWGKARVMQPPDQDQMDLPTVEECDYLSNIAREVSERHSREAIYVVQSKMS